jgi:SAM-dependent methyltransferase
MLIDAALHILELQYQLLKNNLSLKDATPYNIQFRSTRPLFIDLCSIESISHNGVWIAYNQFCQTLLYPLLKFSLKFSDPRGIYLTHMNGLTLKESVQTLGFGPFFRYGMILDYLIPAIIVKLKTHHIVDITKKTLLIDKNLSNSADLQLHTVHRLKKVIKKIRLKTLSNDWQKYRQKCSYADEDYSMKKNFIENFLETSNVKKVIDIGCNLGDFSILAAKKGCHVTAVDSDHDCVNYLYLRSKENDYPILHLWMDITNPSPSIGWLNTERPDFLSRYKGRFDCVFALALVHHLMITNRVPLAEIACLFRKLTSHYLVVEYVGPADSMFRELLKYRNEDYSDLNMNRFEETMSTQFTILNKSELIDTQRQMERCLYLMECKS